MAYITDYQYYENNGVSPLEKNWGSYQYVSLEKQKWRCLSFSRYIILSSLSLSLHTSHLLVYNGWLL